MEEEEDEQFEVEAILKEEVNEFGEKVYFIKWKNYPHDENTWELRRDLLEEGHERAVQDYESTKVAHKKGNTNRARSKTPVKRSGKNVSVRKTPKSASRNAAVSKSIVTPSFTGTRFLRAGITIILLLVSVFLAIRAPYLVEEEHYQEALKLLPGITSFILLMTQGEDDPLVTNAALVSLFEILIRIFRGNIISGSESIQIATIFLWRLFIFRVITTKVVPGFSLFMISLIAWMVVAAPTDLDLDFENCISFLAFYIAVLGLDIWALDETLYNFINAIAAFCALMFMYIPTLELSSTLQNVGIVDENGDFVGTEFVNPKDVVGKFVSPETVGLIQSLPWSYAVITLFTLNTLLQNS